MQQPTVDDVRDLSRRSRRTHRWGLATMAGALLVVPAQMMLASLVAVSWIALAGVGLSGLLLLRFAFVAGEERGAYRGLFKRLKETRTLVVQGVDEREAPRQA